MISVSLQNVVEDGGFHRVSRRGLDRWVCIGDQVVGTMVTSWGQVEQRFEVIGYNDQEVFMLAADQATGR